MTKVHNAISRAGPLLRGSQLALGMSEGGLERLGETLTPIINLWELPEWAALRGERILQQQAISAAGVGQPSGVGIRNPANSGILVVVEHFIYRTEGAANAFDIYQNGTLGVDSSGVHIDQRLGLGDTRGSAFLYTRNGAAADGTIFGRYQCAAGLHVRIDGPWVLGPGHRIAVHGETANTAVTVTYRWRERLAYPGELQI